MLTVILSAALLLAIAGLGIEIGVASWSIRRANRYRRKADAATYGREHAIDRRQRMAKKLESMDSYASGITWLLDFLYNRYDKFSDLEKEVEDGLNGVTGDTPAGEADGRYRDLKKALKLITVTVKAAERMDSLVDSIEAQVNQIADDLKDENGNVGRDMMYPNE
jgi:uncharacterized phage infection (PIP) family protein YhgE